MNLPRPWFPIALVVSGVLTSCVVTAAHAATLGWWQLPVYLGGALALYAATWFRRQANATEEQLAQLRDELAAEEARLANRARTLDERLQTYHEWMEFPAPVDLHERADVPLVHGEVVHRDVDLSDVQVAELARRDRELVKLLKTKTSELYDHVLNNRYYANGALNVDLLRLDARALAEQVARLYQPNSTRPLIETNPGLVLRAVNRVSLHLLVALDDLPVNVKDRGFAELHGYFSTAVRMYRGWQKFEPYWPYLQGAFYAGRFALGASPLTIGAGWVLSTLGTNAAKHAARRVVDYQALKLLSDAVRIIGYEVANLYAGDFRHRDPNWIFGVELTELLSRFPASRATLAQGFKEVGSLPLRSEYDRIFLYRCLAAHVSGRPGNFRAAACLTAAEREAIAGRLERFLAAHLHGVTADKIAAWRAEAERRLAVKLKFAAPRTAATPRDELVDCLRSLAALLVDAKQVEPEELPRRLADSPLAARLADSERVDVFAQVVADPPFFFEPPDLDPASELVPPYLEELVRLHAGTSPRPTMLDERVVEVASYFRRDVAKLRVRLDKAYAAALAAKLADESPVRSVPTDVARAILDLAEADEPVRFVYSHVRLEGDAAERETVTQDRLWLVGAGQRTVLLAVEEPPRCLWASEPGFQVEGERGMLSSACRITGGTWAVEGERKSIQSGAIRLEGPRVGSYQSYFGPLLKAAEKRDS